MNKKTKFALGGLSVAIIVLSVYKFLQVSGTGTLTYFEFWFQLIGIVLFIWFVVDMYHPKNQEKVAKLLNTSVGEISRRRLPVWLVIYLLVVGILVIVFEFGKF